MTLVSGFPAFAGIRWFSAVTVAAAAACASAAPPAHVAPAAANATVIDSAGRRIGSASVLATKAGGLLVLKLSGVPPGEHGLHMHATGACDPPRFDTSGPHYDPANHKHGSKNPLGPHLGDLPNVSARADSSVDTTVAVSAGFVNAIGSGVAARSLILHARSDDLMSDPSGNSGSRIACGVLQR